MIKLVAFDWNGTLLADTKLAAISDRYSLRGYTKMPITEQTMRKYFTVPVINYYSALGLDKKTFERDCVQINKIFNEYYESRVNSCRTRSGTRAALTFLEQKNLSRIIYSNHVKGFIEKQLQRLNLKKHFTAVLARDDDDRSHLHSRGKAAKLHDFVKTHKLKPEQVISVGDTEEEIEIGKQYGFHTVAITGGFNTTARLVKHKPDFLIHNMKELIGIVKRLNMVK